MKVFLHIFFITFLVISCDNEFSPKKKRIDINLVNDLINQKKLMQKSVIVIDMLELKRKRAALYFYSSYNHSKRVITINHEFIVLDEDTCYYYEDNCDSLIKGCLYLNLEFDLFILKVVEITKNGYNVYLNDTILYLPKSKFLKLQTYQEHLSKYILTLKETSPLRKEASDTAQIIPNYTNYEYEVVTFDNEWLKLRTSNEYDSTITGWVKWIKEDSLLVYPVYVY